MDLNISSVFDSTTASSSVSLSCCQSLCDLLRELPLPRALNSNVNKVLTLNLSQNIVNENSLTTIGSQLEKHLFHAKQQLNDLQFINNTTTHETSVSTVNRELSPLLMHLSIKGLFINNNNNNNWNSIESNSLETIEPSIETHLEFNDNLKLINELQNDCDDDQDVDDNDCDDDYSSLGDRVKSRQRMSTTAVTTTTSAAPVVVQQNNNNSSEEVNKDVNKDVNNYHKKSRELKRELNENSLQNKDIVLSFELILNSIIMNDNNDSDDDNEMSFNLDAKRLNLLMSLSSKLKHSNRMQELEQKSSSKLCSFLSLLTNQMIVWFSKFKQKSTNDSVDDQTTTDEDENHFWQLLINASKMSLNIMTSKGMSSRVVLFEELLEIVISFLSNNLNAKTHVICGKSPTKKQKTSTVTTTTTATKKQVMHWTELLELLSEFLTQNKCLNDSIILMITRISMNSLFLNSNEMQLISIQLLEQIFRQYLKHRNSILEELLTSFHRIPFKRNNTLTKLLICLTNSLFIYNSNEMKISRELVTKQLTECLTIISAFLSSFLKKCFQNNSQNECDFKAIFEQLLNDLLNDLLNPSKIASILLIQILTKLLISNLTQKSGINLQIRLNSIEFLAQISSKFAKLLSKSETLSEESMKTLNQLLSEEKMCTKSDEKLLEILKLLNHFFNCEKLFSQKLILSSLWIKENKILEIESQFFSILNQSKPVKDVSVDDQDVVIDHTTAQLFIEYLELIEFSTMSRLFDASLSHVTSSLSLTQNTTQRSRAMKSLSTILMNCSLERSTQLLSRSDLQMAMKSALLDSSTSVREATIDLIGRFVLTSRSSTLCDKYSDLIGERILDTGVSVRKRVIRILRDICIEFPENDKCGEMQLKIIRRVNDEGEGIRRLVLDTMRDLWFSSVSAQTVKFKVKSLLHVISVIIQSNESQTLDSLQLLFEQIVKTNENSFQMIIDFIVSQVIEEEKEEKKEKKVLNLSSIQLISMFSQLCPELVLKHCDSLQSLLSLSCDTLIDIHLRVKVIQTLERCLACKQYSNPSQQLLTRVEEDLTKNILQSSALILSSSVKCLSVLIRIHTKNYKLSQDLFQRFKQILIQTQNESQESLHSSKPKLLRAIYCLGLFLKYFSQNFESKEVILDLILSIINEKLDTERDLVLKCITSLGFIIESDPKICLKPKVIQLYEKLFSDDFYCIQVLNNFRNYLSETIETDELLNKSIEWSRESLKQMVSSEEFDSSSTQSQIIQTFLSALLDKSLSSSSSVRRVACNVIHVIQSGGHVHPLQLVPHLVAMTADDEQSIRSRADHVLHEIERKFHGFVAMKARAGVQLATQLCRRLKCRGFRLVDDGDVTSRLSTLYHVICTTRQSRRGFITQLLRHFDITLNANDGDDDQDIDTDNADVQQQDDDGVDDCDEIQLMFEMVLFFPYNVFDEILYILQQLECIQSVNSTHTSTLFTELFGFSKEEEMEEKFDENFDNFSKELNQRKDEILDKKRLLKQLLRALKCVFLVSFLRKLLKEFYVIKDEKITEYSPNESTKIWEKPIHRRQIETKNLSQFLLRARPRGRLSSTSASSSSEMSVDDVLEELKRFKCVSLTGNDSQISNQLICEKLLTITSVKKEGKKCEINNVKDNEETKRLLDSIKKRSCHVSLIDIASMNSGEKQPKGKNKRKRETDSESDFSESDFD